MNYQIGFDKKQGVLLAEFSGILTQNGLIRHYLDVTDMLENYRMQCSIVSLLNVTSSPLSSKAIAWLSRNEPLYISARPRVFIARGRESIDLWRSFISTNRNPTRTRLAGTMSEALELLGLNPLVLDVRRQSQQPRIDLAVLAHSEAARISSTMEI